MRLEDLSNSKQYKAAEKAIEDAFQDVDTIDGTNLTENQEIKFRRTRLVSEVKPHKKSIHGKDFINYCEFLTGKRESCPKPKGIFNQVLSLIRNNKSEFIIPSYKGIINSYFDLITQAAEIKPRIAKQMIEQNTNKIEKIESKETNMLKKLERKENPENTRKSQKAADLFENWLKENMSDIPNEQKPKNTKYCGWISYYINHNGAMPDYYPKAAKIVLDKYSDILKNFKCRKGILILVSTKSEIPGSYKRWMKLNKKKTNKNTEKAARLFENWLTQNLDFTNSEKPIDKKYCGWVSYYLKHHRQIPSYWPNVAKEIMDKYYSELLNMTPRKGVLIPNSAVNSIRHNEQTDYAIQDAKSTEKSITVTSATNPNFDIPSDTLSKLIKMVKNAGASEITIKL